MSDAPKDRPWLFRTYAGHSTADASNTLYKNNLAKGQTGLSVAFDLPTQTGYDSDHVLARGEVGKVGVPVTHLGDMRTLFDEIPLERMNTSMTINATAPWLLALFGPEFPAASPFLWKMRLSAPTEVSQFAAAHREQLWHQLNFPAESPKQTRMKFVSTVPTATRLYQLDAVRHKVLQLPEKFEEYSHRLSIKHALEP